MKHENNLRGYYEIRTSLIPMAYNSRTLIFLRAIYTTR